MKGENTAAHQVVIVTGASTGIGRETALAFARAGNRVALAARHADQLQSLVEAQPELRAQFMAVPTDITRDDDVRRLIDRTMAEWGRIDVLVNNAGIGMRAAVAESDIDDARRVFDVNFYGALRCITAVLPVMQQQRRGQIVNIGSVLSQIATPGNGVYSASKFALRALSDALRLELKADGIEVILVMPGYTDTPFFDNLIRYKGAARVSAIRGQKPSQVARSIVRACRCHRREVVLSLPGKMGALTKKIAPRFLDWALLRTRHAP